MWTGPSLLNCNLDLGRSEREARCEVAVRVLLVGNYREDRQYSMLGFEDMLAREFPRVGIDVVRAFPRPILGRRRVPSKLAKSAGYMDKFVLFPKELRQMKRSADIVHVLDQGNGMWIPSISDCPHLVTVHDLLALRASRGEIPGWSVGPSGVFLQKLIKRGLAQAANVACVSDATLFDFERVFPRMRDARVIRNGVFREFPRLSKEVARNMIGPLVPQPHAPFLLHVGGNQPYKNRIGAVQIFRELQKIEGFAELRLVLAGHPLSEEIRQEASQELANGSVIEIIRPTDDEVRALYQLAEGLLFPSLVEGFGLPIIEAQSSGCPVFASNRAPLPEIGGGGAVYFDPDDWASAARQVAEAWSERSKLVQRGHANVIKRTPAHCAQDYADEYKRIVKLPYLELTS